MFSKFGFVSGGYGSLVLARYSFSGNAVVKLVLGVVRGVITAHFGVVRAMCWFQCGIVGWFILRGL